MSVIFRRRQLGYSCKVQGSPLPGIELRIIAIGGNEVLQGGQEGEILVRGPTLMPHYVGMRREDSFDPDGWFHSGDIGFIDVNGYLHWTGRIKQMIKTGGANVSPSEIESAAASFGMLKLCRALGIPDHRLGEKIVLCAVLEEGADADETAIRSMLRDKLAAYKVPKSVLFFAIEDYPLTPSGKVKDAELRALAAARLGAHAEPHAT
ncbi:fatty acid--CoA ligase family protein [Novosphingobium sp. G106]|uniref:class I adenylate-forming enzyme family protein n=1 Tax=Novosphingobium sp. G106 TaxID=2849500 RepID=UPI001C2DB188|nr:fatty acid--CoA ligase family protein [Novosphingobium sp. G106]MBV1686450.1 fatty acid--CoA ligase family protein [Novosphingobium sp. G106]